MYGHPLGGEPGTVPAAATGEEKRGSRASRRGNLELRPCDGAAGVGELLPPPRGGPGLCILGGVPLHPPPF